MQPISEVLAKATLSRAFEKARWRRLSVLVAGLVYPLGFAPFGFWPATLASLAFLFFVLLDVRDRREAFLTGWWFGVGQFAVGVSWVYVSIRVYGSASIPLGVGLVAIFVAGMALFTGLATLSVGGRFNRLQRGGVFVAGWIVIEWLLTWFLTGFPWLFAGYSGFSLPVVHLAPVGGVMLVSAALVATAVGAVLALTNRSTPRWVPVGILALVWLGGWGLGNVGWTEPGDARRVALVQGNIPQELKWSRGYAATIRERYERLSAPVWDVDLVIWPEAAVTSWWPQSRPYLEALAARGAATFVTGVPVVEFIADDAFIYNGAVLTETDREQVYQKRRLVPFGDYVPFEDVLRGLIAFFDLPMSNARRGPDDQDVLVDRRGLSIGMAICYEVAYGELVRRDAAQANVLATISNDTWFGASIGPHQHLAIARMRAIETGRYMLRSTNNGVTAVIDPSGRVRAELPQFEEGVLVAEFFPTSGTTPYVRFGNLGIFVVLVALAGSVFFLRRFD